MSKEQENILMILGYSKDVKKPFNLYRYMDADWGNDIDTWKSTTDYVFYAERGTIC